MYSNLRVGIVGVGRIGRFHMETCRQTPGFDVRAVCDPSEAVRESLRTTAAAVYPSPEAMLQLEELDAVFVCTPPAQQIEVAAPCAARSIPVLCEKPFGTDLNEAKELLRLAARYNTPILLASKFRHVPAVERARELLRQDAIGPLVHAEIEFCDAVDMTGRWNSVASQSGGGVIVDAGSHAFDMLQFVAGPLHQVRASRMAQVQQLLVEDGARIHVETIGGATASITVSWSLPAAGNPLLRLEGERGEITVGWRESWVRAQGSEPAPLDGGYDKVDAHRRMYERFGRILRAQEAPWITNEEILAVSEAIEAAYASLDGTDWIALPSTEEVGSVAKRQ